MLIARRVEEVFVAALELNDAEREAYLQSACGDDLALRQEVTTLLTAANESDFYFDGLAKRFGLAALADAEPPLPEAGGFGPWRVLELLGRGGMGAVYLVERRDEHYQQRAALKVLPKGLSSPHAKARFVAERQILARLRHDNIARLLDGGVNEEGTPYFVMDYVEGVPLDEYCDEKGLTVQQRLRLFLAVCDAVQYAHGKLVVHRDIKPGNVLVEKGGDVRLLDFGIAKILDPSDDDGDLTQMASRPVTPAYASPEMLRGEPVDITADVYSLGVLLYVLLTGRPPLDLKGLSPGEVEARVRQCTPQPPSRAIVGGEGKRAAERRRTAASRLAAELRGDLDTVALRALASEPEDRYASVGLLARDLRCYLEGLPIAARAPSLPYRIRKFVTRHKLGVGFAAASAAMLIAVAVLATRFALTSERQAEEIAAERDTARAVTAFLVSVFQSADPDRPAADLTARELLDQGRERIADELADQPQVRVELLQAMSEVYNAMRLSDESRQALLQELALRRELDGTESPDYAATLLRLAQMTDVAGDYEASADYAKQALAISQRLGDLDLEAWAHIRIGRIAHLNGDYSQAEAHYRSGLTIYRKLQGDDGEMTAKSMEHLANLLNHQEHYEASLEMFTEVLRIREQLFGAEHSEIGPALLGLGSVLVAMGRVSEAEAAYQRAYRLNNRIYGPDNRRNSYVISGLGKVAEARGDFQLAAARYAEAGRLVERFFGQHGNLGLAKSYLARAYSRGGDYSAAIPVYRDAIAILENKIPNHWILGDARWRLGDALAHQGDLVEAEALILDGLAIVTAKKGSDHEAARGAADAAAALYGLLRDPVAADRYRKLANAP